MSECRWGRCVDGVDQTSTRVSSGVDGTELPALAAARSAVSGLPNMDLVGSGIIPSSTKSNGGGRGM